MVDVGKIAKTSQEQAIAAWVDYLNKVRITDLIASLNQQDGNLQDALDSLRSTVETLQSNVIEIGRGGQRGMHGFIAEVAEVGIGNARKAVQGQERIYDWVNNNGPDDIRIGDVLCQMKFVQGGGSFSLDAVAKHLESYPDYLEAGHKYIIPKDFYEKVKTLMDMDADTASRLTRDDNLSLKDWKRVHEFFNSHDVTLDDIEPSQLEYDQVQRGTIAETMRSEEASIRSEDEKIRAKAYEESKPSLGQAAQVTLASAVIEGAGTFVTLTAQKMREGKSIREFTQEDWQDIAKGTGGGFAKGGVRGATIYALTNYTATPGAVASSLCTAAFGVADQAHRFRNQEIGEVEFIQSAEIVCLDAAVSALSSAIGQAVIPIPVLGAVIGNTVGSIIYQTAKDGLSAKEQEIMEKRAEELQALDRELSQQYRALLVSLREDMSQYLVLLEAAFHPDPLKAMEGSAALAIELGIPQSEVLDSIEKTDAFFLD